MTQVFLIYLKEKDEYIIKTIGLGYRVVRIPRPDDITDEGFKTSALATFYRFIEKEQIIEGEIIRTEYIF